jgi:anti-sigma factor RsiW
MNCRKCRAELERLLDNELAQGERAVVEQHLAACAECRQKLSELQALNLVLKVRPGVEPGPDYLAGFNDRFWHEVKRRRRMQSLEPERKFLPVFWTRVAATAAAALLLITVGLVGYRSWHTFFEHPGEALRETQAPQAAPETGKALETAVPKAVVPGAARARDVDAEKRSEPEPNAAGEMARPATPPALAPVQPAQANAQTLSLGAQMKTASGGGTGRSAQKQEIQPAPPPVVSGSGPGYGGARKGGLKLADETPVKKSGQAPGQEVGGIKAQALDTVIYSEEKLGAKPVLVSIPDAGDDDRMKYPNMEVPVWVVIEKDGSVSRAESRATTANAGLERVALSLARQAQFLPGKRAGNAVRVGKTIVVKIRALKQKDD